jgi:archaemetzincin
MEVHVLKSHALKFTHWDKDEGDESKVKKKRTKSSSSRSTSKAFGLQTSSEAIRIRARSVRGSPFAGQLNLNDLLDVAIEIIPPDAYAVLMVVHHDLYEDDEDDFACGRAYGASRVAVVSTARYNPALDKQQNVERIHAWPASHCEEYVQEMCGKEGKSKQESSAHGKPTSQIQPGSPMLNALAAHIPLQSSAPFEYGCWLARVCRTASHELGHCLGLDHCVYYACVMQGTTSLSEDVRQPPYLCPVDLVKVLTATGSDVVQRYTALLEFCERFCDQEGEVELFRAFAGWLRIRIETHS